MEKLEEKITAIVIGIRFARSFRIPDISGDIIDDILYGFKTPFKSNFFPIVQEHSDREKILVNDKTSEYLKINTDDVILKLEVNNDFQKKFNWIKGDIMNYFKNDLFRNFKINKIRRIGVIFVHKIKKDSRFDSAISAITNKELVDASCVNISFAKKDPTAIALYRKNVNDYRNTIYSFREGEGEMEASLDYQYYFDPYIEDLRECFSENIFNDAIGFFNNNYYKWLENHGDKL